MSALKSSTWSERRRNCAHHFGQLSCRATIARSAIVARAFKVGKVAEYRRLINQIQRLGKKLRLSYYKSKVDHLYSADQRSWWRKVKRFLNNLSNGNSLQQQLPGGISIADVINDLFASVSADLPPLSDDILRQLSKDDYCDRFIIDVQDVENRLMHIDISKAAEPDELSNCILRDFTPL